MERQERQARGMGMGYYGIEENPKKKKKRKHVQTIAFAILCYTMLC